MREPIGASDLGAQRCAEPEKNLLFSASRTARAKQHASPQRSGVFSGKTDDVGFLLLKARAAARKLPCAHRRSAHGAQAFILNGGPPISYAEFFDLPARLIEAGRGARQSGVKAAEP